MTVIYTTSFHEQRLDEDRWNRILFFFSGFRSLIFFSQRIKYKRSFVASLNGVCRSRLMVPNECWNCTLFVLLMPQIVNHKKEEVKAPTHSAHRGTIRENQRSNSVKNYTPFFDHRFFLQFFFVLAFFGGTYDGFNPLRCCVMFM